MKNDFENIKVRYEKRKSSETVALNNSSTIFNENMVKERNSVYRYILKTFCNSSSSIKILEIGAGSGGNLLFFQSLGILPGNCYANDIIPERADLLRENLPGSVITEGNALDLPYKNEFDIVFQSTVFSSVQFAENRRLLAAKMVSMCKPGGIILWYDFMYDNPKNKDVNGIKKKEVVSLFEGTEKLFFKKVTLAPPVGRRVGRAYSFFNRFSFLRTHCIAVFKIPKGSI